MFHRLDWLLRHLLPGLTLLFLGLLSFMPLPLPYWSHIAPNLSICAVFFWAVYRPGLLPQSVLFAYGLLIDLLSAAPLGMSSLIYLTLRFFTLRWRSFLIERQLIMLWIIFFSVTGLAAILEWLGYSFIRGQWLSLSSATYQALMTAVTFPIFYYLILSPVRNWLPPAEDMG